MVRGYCARLLGIETSQDPRDADRDRRRLRRQDRGLSRAAGARAVEEVRPAGQDGDDPRGGVPRHRPDLGRAPCASRSAPRRTARSPPPKASSSCQAGAFPGSPVQPGAACAPSPATTSPTSRSSATTSSATGRRSPPTARPARRSRRSRVESVDRRCSRRKLRHGPDRAAPEERRQARAPRPPTVRSSAPIGFVETLRSGQEHPSTTSAPLGPNQGRGVAAGFWFNVGGDRARRAARQRGRHASPSIAGTPDIGGSRASLAHDGGRGARHRRTTRCAPIIADTASIGFNFVTGGSRVTFATGMAVVERGARRDHASCKVRAAKIWDVDPGRA